MDRPSFTQTDIGDKMKSKLEKLLKIEDVVAMTAISRSAIYAKMKAGEFPNSRRVGGQSVRWRQSEVQDWIQALPECDPNDWHSPNRQ